MDRTSASGLAAAMAPEFEVSAWLNTPGPLTLASLRGKVVAVYAFQMLCPGCVSYALPQARQMEALFGRHELAVLGLHTVFEHHAAMSPEALAAFLHEYRVKFPVGVDMPGDDGPIPRTMARYRMRGTPTLLLVDRAGVLRHSLFGHQPDLLVGKLVGQLLAEAPAPACDEDGCRLPEGSAPWNA